VRSLELIAAIGVLFSFCLTIGFGLHYYFPDVSSACFVAQHYLGPFVTVAIIMGLLKSVSQRHEFKNRLYLDLLRDMLSFLAVIWIHFNLKLWSQMINSGTYDEVYLSLDNRLGPLVDRFRELSVALNELIPEDVNAYHDVFVAMFVVSFFAHALQRNYLVFQKLLASTALILLIGGAAYALAPAMGPFSFGEWGANATKGVQEQMLNFYTRFLAARGDIHEPGYFVAAVAAMPSLHMA